MTTTHAKHWIRVELLASEALFQYVQPFPRNPLINVQAGQEQTAGAGGSLIFRSPQKTCAPTFIRNFDAAFGVAHGYAVQVIPIARPFVLTAAGYLNSIYESLGMK